MKICKYIAIISLFFFVFTLCSCTRVIKTPADEIRLNGWSCEFKDKSSFSLGFMGDDALIIILNSNKKEIFKIYGKAFIDKKRIVVFDEGGNNYVFKYNLKGSVLSLKYNGGEISLKKSKTDYKN